jgi:hypothetical protein
MLIKQHVMSKESHRNKRDFAVLTGVIKHHITCVCDGTGHVCENHPERPWGEMVSGGCSCGAGMACPIIDNDEVSDECR